MANQLPNKIIEHVHQTNDILQLHLNTIPSPTLQTDQTRLRTLITINGSGTMLLRGCLVPVMKNFGGVTSDVSWDVERSVRILIKN
jgi:hypothetical protein